MKLKLFAAIIVVSLTHAHAALLDGQTIRTQFFSPDLATQVGSTIDTVVGPGTEIGAFPDTLPISNIDFGDTTIRITMTTSRSGSAALFDGYVFSDFLNTITAFNVVELDPASTLGFNFFSFDQNQITVNLSGISFAADEFLLLNITAVGQIPEPDSALFLLIGTGFLVRKNRRNSKAHRCHGQP